MEGWPYTEASVIFRDRVADHDDTSLTRLRTSGAVLAAQTTAPEFGGINCTSTELHGTTRNPWNLERTPGGSSGGRRQRSPGASCRSRRGATVAAPSGARRRSAASSASRRPTGGFPKGRTGPLSR